MKSVAWDAPTLKAFDLVVIATQHKIVNYNELAKWASCIVDTRNAMVSIKTRTGQVFKA